MSNNIPENKEPVGDWLVDMQFNKLKQKFGNGTLAKMCAGQVALTLSLIRIDGRTVTDIEIEFWEQLANYQEK